MLVSVDGKISTGSTDELDVDKDFPKIKRLKSIRTKKLQASTQPTRLLNLIDFKCCVNTFFNNFTANK